MGDRANIELKQTGGSVHLYTHWGGSDVPGLLNRALEIGRQDDPSYMARTIASQVFQAAGINDASGAGLAPVYQDGTPWVVDLEAKTITAPVGWKGSGMGVDAYKTKVFTYAEFIEACRDDSGVEFEGGE
jgi:hypothetical protein